MLGNPSEFGRRIALALATALILAACAKNVSQGANTGPDGKSKGAKAVELEGNEGEVSGIVTYPGGDRVDWKSIELPAGKRGALELELTWRPPRPGLDLAFDVYTEWGEKVGGVKPKKPAAAKKSKRKRGSKKTTIENAGGKLFVAIYASNRGDAGKYRFKVTFKEAVAEVVKVFDPGSQPIPDPPKLAAVPPPCDPMNIDANNPECAGVFPPCDEAKPDKKNPNCATVCDPNALDPANPNCLKFYPDCDPLKIDAKNPKCAGVTKPKATPKDGIITSVEVTSGGTIIQVNLGSKDGVDRNWPGEIVDGAGRPVQNGGFVVFKVQERRAFAKVKLTRDVVNKNLQVKLYPPD